MEPLTSTLKQVFNLVSNPIIVKELRSRMRGPRAFITLTGVLIIMALVSYAFYQLVIITSTWSYSPLSPQIGQTLFVALAVLEMMMICLITPAVTAGAISSEHEKLTYEMLLTTPLVPTQILWGKLISALSYIFLLIFAAIPIGSLVFIYGGVAPRDMLKAILVLICTAIMLGTIGIFMSTWLKRSGRATIASYMIVLGLLGAPTILYTIIAIIRQGEPPRWLLVPSPINALFSAISPSTSLGSSGISMIGSLSMLMGGNLGSIINTNSIPRPLYHYTLPLYGLITLVLYLLAARLIRPARRWQFKIKEIGIGVIAIMLFIGIVILAFSRSTDRYENISIFAAPTPFLPVPVEPRAMVFEESLREMPLSNEDSAAAYAAVIREIFNQDLFPDTPVIILSRQTYSDPANPEGEKTTITILPDSIQEGIPILVEDLPFDFIWQDDFAEIQTNENAGALLLFGNFEPLKPDFIQVHVSIQFPDDQPGRNLILNTIYRNGVWNAQLQDITEQQSPYPRPQNASGGNLQLSFDDIGSIYGKAILQAYTIDTPLPGVEISNLHLVQSTDFAADPIILPPEVQNMIAEKLDFMPFELHWVENQEMVLSDIVDQDAAIVTLGNITPSEEDGSVEVIIDFYFSKENRILVTYILRNIDGEWQITDFGGLG